MSESIHEWQTSLIPRSDPRFGGVELYRMNFSQWDELKRKALANLKAGIETWCHWHSYHDDPEHKNCEMFVLDWHNELPFCRFKQIVCIFPGVDLEKHAVGRKRIFVTADNSTVESSIEYAQRVNARCRP